LEWEPPPINQRNGIIQYYLVTIDQVENATTITLIANTTQIIVRNLFPYYTYEVTIAAVTNPGTGPWSSLLTVMLPEAGKLIHNFMQAINFMGGPIDPQVM
jgi:receptor-type tyrosine-protein phosphatase Q